ncbi:hypothetical protein N7536_012484 [Penicillium majusculum]|nr:hypothetical protein N7536_012484 [Penicillium majusculum]
MEEHHHVPLSLKEIMALQHSEGLTEYEAWRQAVIYYNQQRGGHADATILASTSDEIPLGESVLISKTAPASSTPATYISQPPVNAAGESHIFSGEYWASYRLWCCYQAVRRQHLGCLPLRPPPPPETTDTRQDKTDEERTQEAHVRYWAAIGGVDKDIEKRL